MVVGSSVLDLTLAGTTAAGLVHDHDHLPPPGQICYSHLHSTQTTQLELLALIPNWRMYSVLVTLNQPDPPGRDLVPARVSVAFSAAVLVVNEVARTKMVA